MSIHGSLKFGRFFLFAPENSIISIVVLDIIGDNPQTITFLIECEDDNTKLRFSLHKGSLSNLPIEDFADKNSVVFLQLNQILVQEISLETPIEIVVIDQSVQINGEEVSCAIESIDEGSILVNLKQEYILQL